MNKWLPVRDILLIDPFETKREEARLIAKEMPKTTLVIYANFKNMTSHGIEEVEEMIKRWRKENATKNN